MSCLQVQFGQLLPPQTPRGPTKRTSKQLTCKSASVLQSKMRSLPLLDICSKLSAPSVAQAIDILAAVRPNFRFEIYN
jgi:hypothetical protein